MEIQIPRNKYIKKRKKLSKPMRKVLGMSQLKKLDIDMWKGKSKAEILKEHDAEKAKAIAKAMSKYGLSKEKAEGAWLEDYPTPSSYYAHYPVRLTTAGHMDIIKKINEIVDYLNKL